MDKEPKRWLIASDVSMRSLSLGCSWRVEKQQEEADDDDGGLMASLIKKRKSKYTPASRDKAELTLNERNNLVFSGGLPP